MALATSSTVFDIFEINFRALILAVIVGVSCSLILKRSSDSGRMADVYTGDGGVMSFTFLSTFKILTKCTTYLFTMYLFT